VRPHGGLVARGITVDYGCVRALDDVDLEVEPGALVGLIGPNGAGKTTLIDALSGFACCRGTVWLDGRELRGTAHRRARAGLRRTWQAVQLFDDLSVAENVAIASERLSPRRALAELVQPRRARDDARTERALKAVGLVEHAEHAPAQLSHGQRKLVGVARALAAEPKLLALDEPAAGLDANESSALGRTLRAIADGGTSVLLVDHDMALVMAISDEVLVIDFGRVIAHGPPEGVQQDRRVREAYLGASDEGAV